MKIWTLAVALVLPAASLLAQPAVTLIGNNYGWVPPGSPGYGIALGSIFAIKGTNLGPAQTVIIGSNQQPTAGFGEVTISVTVSGKTVQALNYYAGPQLAAVLPSNTPVGEGTLTVTYNGQTSAPVPIKVVANAFGILTMDSSGHGTAKVCDYGLDITCKKWPSFTNSARPGDTIDIWGAGLGPTANDATFVDLTNIVPMRVWIGGEPVGVTAAWRSTFMGLDFIRTVIPYDITWGCYVSLAVQIGNYISNFTTLPVATNGGACLDPVTGLSGDALAALTAKDPFTIASVSLSQATTNGATDETASAAFYQYHPSQLAETHLFNTQQYMPQVAWGSCTVWIYQTDSAGNAVGVDLPQALDAGVINVTSNGTEAIHRDAATGTYSLDLNSSTFYGGNVTVAGTGGARVGSFSTSVVSSLGFQWTNQSAVSTIDRASGLIIQWANAAPLTSIEISGSSLGYDPSTQKPTAIATFSCLSPVGPTGASGQFMIPSSVLLALPPTLIVNGHSFGGGSLSVSNRSNSVSFTAAAPGIDAGFLTFMATKSQNVTYQ